MPPLHAVILSLALAFPAWARPAHPLVHYELRHWARSRTWRWVRGAVWGGGLVFLLVPVGCTLLFGLQATISSRAEAILVIGGTFSAGVAIASVLATWINNLTATLLGATLIARERECQTWPFLRLTTLTSGEILGGKFAALLYSVARTVHFTAGLRLLALAAGVTTGVLAAGASGLRLADALAWLRALVPTPQDWATLWLWGGLSLPLAVLGWLLEPYFGVVYNGGVGLAASALARSRGTGIVLAVAGQFVLGLGLYAPAQQVLTLLLALSVNASAPAIPIALPAQSFLLQAGTQVLLRVAVLVACLVFTLRRLEHLSE